MGLPLEAHAAFVHSLRVNQSSVIQKASQQAQIRTAPRFHEGSISWPPIAYEEVPNSTWPGSFRLRSQPSAPQAFLLAGQVPAKDLILVARYTHEAAAFQDIRNAIRSLDAQAPIDLHTLDQDIHDGMQNGRVLAQVVTTLAGLALFFGACGLFAVISQSVVLRMPEIGVRLALGASPASIRGMIFQSGLRLLAIGATLGLLCGVLLANVLASQLVGVHPTDWQIWLPSAVVLLMVSLIALAVPALRAARADILAVMRRD